MNKRINVNLHSSQHFSTILTAVTACLPSSVYLYTPIFLLISKTDEFLTILFSFLLISPLSVAGFSLSLSGHDWLSLNTKIPETLSDKADLSVAFLFRYFSWFLFFVSPSLHICLSYLFAVWCYPRNQSKHWTTAASLTQYLPVFPLSLPSFPSQQTYPPLLGVKSNCVFFFFSEIKKELWVSQHFGVETWFGWVCENLSVWDGEWAQPSGGSSANPFLFLLLFSSPPFLMFLAPW